MIAANNAAQIYERVKPVEVTARECDLYRDLLPIYIDGDMSGLTRGDLVNIRRVNEVYQKTCEG